MSNSSVPLLSAHSITKSFGPRTARHQVLFDVSADVHAGECLAVIGGSGSGKSTLTRIMLGLESADSGSVEYESQSIVGGRKSPGFAALRRESGLVFQDPFSSLDPRWRVAKSVAEPLSLQRRDLNNTDIDERVAAALTMAGLEPADFLNRYPIDLSGGQAQRVVIARAIINEPKVILADEPMSAIDVAIFQCLVGERAPVRRLIVTCSGGAFRDFRAEELANVTVEQALRHPQWDMGAKITIDSSTLVNKGFEVIEAHWLFGTPAERISVLLHPQSIIHSMVEFEDGAIKAQLGTPDMRLPISFALLYPDRANRPGERFNFLNHPQLTFAEVDRAKYPALDIAYDCLRRGGTAACTMNGANEVAVAAFLARKCAWLDIVRAIRYALEHAAFVPSPTLADYAEANAEARALAAEFLQLKN